MEKLKSRLKAKYVQAGRAIKMQMVERLTKMNPLEWKNIPIPLIDGFIVMQKSVVEIQKQMQDQIDDFSSMTKVEIFDDVLNGKKLDTVQNSMIEKLVRLFKKA